MKHLVMTLFAILILSGCAFDGLFLFPYELDSDTKMKRYSSVFEDTISISFDGHQPQFHHSDQRELVADYTIESIDFVNRRGDTLNSWLIEPKENFNGKMMYFLHGNAGNVLYQYALATPFAKKGYKVFMIDYSGFGFSDGESTRENVLTDAYDGFDYLAARKTDIGYESIIIYGQSLGGHLAVVTAKKYQDQIAALVIEGAFSSHRNVAATRVPVLPYLFMKEMYSAKDSIGLISTPKLVIHSTIDETVKYKLGEKLYQKASEPKMMYTIDSAHVRGPLYYLDSIVYRMELVIGD